ncbi:SUN domain-containing protein 1-like [Aulostomus maculatus]
MNVCDEDVGLQSWGWTDLSSYWSVVPDSEKEPQLVSSPQARIMSRRSLRLDDGLLDRSLPLSSASFSVGGSSWRNNRSLKSRRSQQSSVSCSESVLFQTPRKVSNQSLHSCVSDASLLSSLLDESSIQEATLVDTLWGLDQDIDPKESTIIAEQSSVLANSTVIASDGRHDEHSVHTLSRVHCKDCESDMKEPVTTYCSSSRYAMPLSMMGDPKTSTIYCRDRGRSRRTGVVASVWDSGVSVTKRSAACILSLLALLCHHLLPPKPQSVTAHSSRCGVMNPPESNANQNAPHPNGSLSMHAAALLTPTGADCQEKERSDMDTVSSSSSARASVVSCLLRLMWNASVFTGKTAVDLFKWLIKRWHHTNISLLLSRFPLRLLVVLLPLLLFSGLQAVSIAAGRRAVSDISGLSSLFSFMPSEATEGAVEESREAPGLQSGPPLVQEEEAVAAADDSARLIRVEQSLMLLWDRMEAGGKKVEQRHSQLLQLFTDLEQQIVSAHHGGEGTGPWLSGLLDQQLSQLRTRLGEDRRQREQDLVQQQSQTSRLDQLELQLQTLAEKTQEVTRRQEAAATNSPAALPAADRVAVDRLSHDALLAEVTHLEAALEAVRREVESLSGCHHGCQRLDQIQQTISAQVSAQVHEEVRALIYGNQLTVRGKASEGAATLPESLLRLLSQQYVSGADLQASLAALELSILQNISQQMEPCFSQGAVRETVLHATEAAGATVTQEDVNMIVMNALRLFSQDRTGMADYALESGGGSIMSTRCSETYETKAALLSLFGVPLWYFSQSPRAVIQPDVHPGNCWAFRGSTGFLVIRLSMRILPTAFSLEHIPKALAPSGTLHSAPRDFSVYGLDDESQERGTLLGSYTYEEDGEALQTYSVTEVSGQAFQIIEVQVLSNWGHQDYTCMYRFRVHGTPSDN